MRRALGVRGKDDDAIYEADRVEKEATQIRRCLRYDGYGSANASITGTPSAAGAILGVLLLVRSVGRPGTLNWTEAAS